MGELGSILAETIPLELGGKEWTFSKINLGIMADFETIMAARRLKRALTALGPDATPADRAGLISELTGRASADVTSDLYRPEGIRLILYLCIKGQHPDVTEEDIGRLITMDRLPEFQAFVDKLTDDSGKAVSQDSGNAAKKSKAGRHS